MSDISPVNPFRGAYNIPQGTPSARPRGAKGVKNDKNDGIMGNLLDRNEVAESLQQRDSFLAKLLNMPESRPDVVELGRQLAQAPDFPSDESLEQLAQALVTSMDQLLAEESPP